MRYEARMLRPVFARTWLSRGLAVICVASGWFQCGCGSEQTPADGRLGRPDAAADAAPGAHDGFGIPEACRGFPLEGIRYSPGGSVLPNTCEPFDPVLNNPYAVRCIDALPGYRSGYPGDDYCILPPPPELGMQVGVHPQGQDYWHQIWAGDLSGYEDAELTAPFELEAGGEIEQTYDTSTPNGEEHYYYRLNSRMRTGSHHLASFFSPDALPEGWVEGPPQPGGFEPEDLNFSPSQPGDPLLAKGAFFNVQRADADRPSATLALPAEDRGLGMPIGPRQGIHFDLHHFNVTTGPILREVWINAWWATDVTEPGFEFAAFTDVSIEPGEVKELAGEVVATGDLRILTLFGHRHAWTSALTAQVERSDGTVEPVYASYDWLEVPTYSYDSVTQNPEFRSNLQADAGYSGILRLQAGDKLTYTCKVEATHERGLEVGAPMPTETLVFGNHVFTAEMCILYGFGVGQKPTGAVTLN